MKKIFIFLSIISIFFITDSVNAFTVADYDPRLSLFDGFENILPVCDKDIYVSDSGFVGTNSSWNRVCYEGTVPNIRTLIEYVPYITRIEYKIKNSDKKYYVFMFDSHCNGCDISPTPYVQENNILYQAYSHFIISLLPESGFITTNSGEIIALESTYSSSVSSDVYVTQTIGKPMPFSSSIINNFDFGGDFVFDNNNPYFDITVKTNYNLIKIENNSSNIIVNATTGHEFETDVDITVPIDNYLLLVPKKNEEFSSYLWTDSNFAYSEMYYDLINSTYSNLIGGGFNEINFGAMGGFNWFRWEFSFTDIDLSFKKVIMIYNHSSTNLNIKLFSSDFYYKLMNESSSSFCVGDICYANDYDNFKTFAYSTGSINNKYDTEDYDNGLSFIKNIPNMVKDFNKSFVFIGTLFTTVFSIFTGSLLNYFYIIFGILIIMLIIKILK